MRRLRHHTWGFSLIEVLIALTILAVGLAAIVKFQATVFGYSASAKERALAARLADEKIADLRGYETLSTTANRIAYQDIGADTGGALSSGTVMISNVNYTRSWAVVDYYYPNIGVTPMYGAIAKPHSSEPAYPPPPVPAYPHFKLVTVTIAWNDQSNVDQCIELPDFTQCIKVSTIISAHDPAKSGKAIG